MRPTSNFHAGRSPASRSPRPAAVSAACCGCCLACTLNIALNTAGNPCELGAELHRRRHLHPCLVDNRHPHHRHLHRPIPTGHPHPRGPCAHLLRCAAGVFGCLMRDQQARVLAAAIRRGGRHEPLDGPARRNKLAPYPSMPPRPAPNPSHAPGCAPPQRTTGTD